MSAMSDPFGARTPLDGHGLDYFRLGRLDDAGIADTARLPYTLRVLLEMALRNAGSIHVTTDDVRALADWPAPAPDTASVAFLPARVLLQDFTGVPASSTWPRCARDGARGEAPPRVDPLVPADLVIDHSVQVDAFGSPARSRAIRARVRAQRRAVRAAAVGAARVRRLPCRAAGDGDRATR